MAELETTNNQGQNNATDTESTKTYTQEEVDKLLQSEVDRRITGALKKQEAKNAERLKEAQKLSQMNEEQKYQYELEQREKAIAEKERQLTLAENKNVASKILSEKGISLDLVDFVLADDADTMDENIKRLDKAFKNSVKAEVEKRLGTKTPQVNLSTEPVSRESYLKMSMADKQKFARDNPELYASFH